MSVWSWEAGVIKLPSAEFARVRKAIQDRHNEVADLAFEQTQEFWKSLTRKQRTDPTEYRKAAREWVDRRRDQLDRAHRASSYGVFYGHRRAQDARDRTLQESALEEAAEKVDPWGGRAPARVLASEMDRATNRTLEFITSDAGVFFDKEAKTVRWHVEENNRATESARNSWLGQELFGQLDTVRWTRGTGGVLTGNDEMNAESREYGGGANYHTSSFGPIGAAEAPGVLRPYTDSQGRKFDASGPYKPNRFTGAYEPTLRQVGGPQGRVPKGVRAGGQFTAGHRPEAQVRLR